MSQVRPTLLLFGGAGAPGLGVDIAVQAMAEAHSRGLRVHLANHPSLLAPTAEACEMADEVSAVDPEDVRASIRWARETVAGGARFDVVFCTREFSLESAAEIAAAHGIAGNPPDVVRRARNKDLCRARLSEAGFQQPSVWLCHDADARARVAGAPGPWVVKPRSGGGSEGVRLVRSEEDLAAALGTLPGAGRPFLLEEFVDGAEYSVEGLFLAGRPHVLAVTAKEKLPFPFFVEVGHVLPAPLEPRVRDEIVDTVTRALEAIELRFGLFHVELWLTGGGPVLGELHARLGGDYIHRLLAHAIPDLEMFGRVFDDALGRSVAPPGRDCVRAAATRYLAPPPGRLVAVEGWDEARSHPAVLAAELTVAPGQMIAPVRSSDDRVGALVVGAGSPREASDLARRLVESVQFVVEPAASPSRILSVE